MTHQRFHGNSANQMLFNALINDGAFFSFFPVLVLHEYKSKGRVILTMQNHKPKHHIILYDHVS